MEKKMKRIITNQKMKPVKSKKNKSNLSELMRTKIKQCRKAMTESDHNRDVQRLHVVMISTKSSKRLLEDQILVIDLQEREVHHALKSHSQLTKLKTSMCLIDQPKSSHQNIENSCSVSSAVFVAEYTLPLIL